MSPPGSAGLPFSGPVPVDPRYLSSVTPALPPPPPPPPMSMLYSSPPQPPGLLLPEVPFYRRPAVMGFSDDSSDKSSPELADGGVSASESGGGHGHCTLDSVETSLGLLSGRQQLSRYPSLQLLHTQLEALRHYQQQQQQQQRQREMTRQDAEGELLSKYVFYIHLCSSNI